LFRADVKVRTDRTFVDWWQWVKYKKHHPKFNVHNFWDINGL